MDARNRRRRELHRLRDIDPSQLISMYRRATALDPDSPLPLAANFVAIVEAILDSEFSNAALPNESL